MSHNIVLHVDGSQMGRIPDKLKGKVKNNRIAIGWAFIALHDDNMVECYGIKTGKHVQDKHEWFAMIEAFLYAKSHGYSNSEISVYTDCQDFSDCIFSIDPNNYRFVARDNWINRITKFLQDYYKHINTNEFIEFLQTARIHKVKGHSFLVYNTRVDRLAKLAVMQFFCPSKRGMSLPSFEDWIKKCAGFKVAFSYGAINGNS
jgi:ribonuclease HI